MADTHTENYFSRMSRRYAKCISVAFTLFLAPLHAPIAQTQTPPLVDWIRLNEFARIADITGASDSVLHANFPGFEVSGIDLPTVAGRVIILTDHAQRVQWIAARGTENFEDVLLDAESVSRPDRHAGVRLHRGFEKYADAAYARVYPLLRQGYRVNLTGHSLGGAAAAIIMMYLHADGVQLGEVVTFGQPKVTDAYGVARYAGAPITRVVDCRDPIPLTPPRGIRSAQNGEFRHFGREIVLYDGPLHSVLPEHYAERLDVTSFWHSLPRIEARDHKMSNYRARIEPKLHGAREIPFRPGEPYACTPAR